MVPASLQLTVEGLKSPTANTETHTVAGFQGGHLTHTWGFVGICPPLVLRGSTKFFPDLKLLFTLPPPLKSSLSDDCVACFSLFGDQIAPISFSAPKATIWEWLYVYHFVLIDRSLLNFPPLKNVNISEGFFQKEWNLSWKWPRVPPERCQESLLSHGENRLQTGSWVIIKILKAVAKF